MARMMRMRTSRVSLNSLSLCLCLYVLLQCLPVRGERERQRERHVLIGIDYHLRDERDIHVLQREREKGEERGEERETETILNNINLKLHRGQIALSHAIELHKRLISNNVTNEIFVCLNAADEDLSFRSAVLTSASNANVRLFFAKKTQSKRSTSCVPHHPRYEDSPVVVVTDWLLVSNTAEVSFLVDYKSLNSFRSPSSMEDAVKYCLMDHLRRHTKASISLTDTHPPISTIFPMFQPASIVSNHKDGPCKLWWPLDGSEVYLQQEKWSQYFMYDIQFVIQCDGPILQHNQEIIFHGGANIDEVKTLDVFGPIHYNSSKKCIFSLISQTDYRVTKTSKQPFNAIHARLVAIVDEQIISDFKITLIPIFSDDIPLSPPLSLPPMINSYQGTRTKFGFLLNAFKLSGVFVEIGVNQARFASETILPDWRGDIYIGVDPWHTETITDYEDAINDQAVDRDVHMNIALDRIRPWIDRVIILREFGAAAVQRFVLESLDAVYIDAIHNYQSVMSDMQMWWPLVRRGGILSGHDYELNNSGDTVFTVKPAVDEFARKIGLPVFHIHDSTNGPSWFIVKPL